MTDVRHGGHQHSASLRAKPVSARGYARGREESCREEESPELVCADGTPVMGSPMMMEPSAPENLVLRLGVGSHLVE